MVIEGIRVHDEGVCEPPCPFHSPSDHPLKDARIHIRVDKEFLVERICPHGVGHDDPDSVAYMQRHGAAWAGVHGCDGCCSGNYGKLVAPSVAPDAKPKETGMNEKLGLPFQATGKMQKVVICFDVDGTLMDYNGQERERVTKLLMAMYGLFKNAKIVIWSGGGNKYAQDSARRLGIDQYAWKFMSKHQYQELKSLGYTIIAIDDIQDTAIGNGANLIVRQ